MYKGGRNVPIPIKVGINPLTMPIIIGIINVKTRVHFMEKKERGGGGKKSIAAQVKKKKSRKEKDKNRKGTKKHFYAAYWLAFLLFWQFPQP